MYRLVAGEKQKTIAIALDITQTRLSIIVNSPLFKKELRKMENAVYETVVANRGDIGDRVSRLQPTALSVIEDIMKSKTTGKALKRQCANDILEMGQKARRVEDDDALNPFAKVIQTAFKLAETNRDQSENGFIKPEDKVIEVDSMELNSETGLAVDPPDDESEEESMDVNESVEAVLGEMGIMDPAELPEAS